MVFLFFSTLEKPSQWNADVSHDEQPELMMFTHCITRRRPDMW